MKIDFRCFLFFIQRMPYFKPKTYFFIILYLNLYNKLLLINSKHTHTHIHTHNQKLA